MNKTAHSIFVTVTPSKEFLRHFKKQTRSNRGFKILAIVSTACVIWSEVNRRKQEEELYQLKVRVKKLEQSEKE